MRKLFLGAAIATCSVVGLHPSNVAAQEAGGSVDVERIEAPYVVKFLCGAVGGDDEDDFLAPVTYLTAINVANLGNANINLRVRVLESLRADEGPGAATSLPALPVRRGRALEIDCFDIFTALEPEDQFFKGFLVITAPQGANIQVAAVYSYGGGTDPIDFGGGTPQ